MAARGLVNGEGPTKWEGFSFPYVTLLNFSFLYHSWVIQGMI